ncbi:Eco57I restriction-modification methylase domain-containing protein [Leptospira bandrabouensis]|uniref:Eco57I restriction-modification methylase domain-containing protein n=1 Tax=Leptospira bandrabouensis TaxID=2484903 RepID=UPI001EE79EDF|nr:N-6 DNA methylase [Leptospira bandrabouensis]MCG6146507.1 N-6 DNA methylase [Leptospira bandrabouensis]MCG6161879.1 N-6 DNA methylase [Leptospira bandrabouensis]MCG6166070.1 N-6 DNA methylase [Leptospira bandrabouensis]
MLSSSDRSKLKSKVGKLKNLLIEKFTDYANTRYYLQISEEKRKKQLQENNPIGFYEWELIEKKLQTNGMDIKEYIIERSYTYLNRTFFLMRLEILGIQKYPVFYGMKDSSGWTEFKLFCPNLCQDADEGYLFLTRQVSDYYAKELPGLFLDDSADRAFGIPGDLIYELFLQWNDPELASAFLDDTTAGWIYQYWNDPDREAINERVKDKGKVQGKEIASATQLFTERYMVEWLIQNSVGNVWLSICKKNKWNTSATTCLSTLQKRRDDHNQKIAKKTISEDTPLLIQSEEEEFWKYYLFRELTEEEIQNSISSIREIKLLDPACGSGHFLLYAFYFLFYLYKEEDRILKGLQPTHVEPSDTEIAKSILEKNLYGVDLDPRAVQIAVASLYTTARKFGDVNLTQLHLVATRPSIGSQTKKEDLEHFKKVFCESLKVPKDVATSLIELLGKSDVFGSLLQIRKEIQNQVKGIGLYVQETEENIFSKLEEFVKNHDLGNDLGIFTLGTQLSRGLRLIRILDTKFDVVVANPPYLSKSKFDQDTSWIFPDGVNELYELFIYQILNLLKPHGRYGVLSAQNFMFISQFEGLRKKLILETNLDSILHLGSDSFIDVLNALGFVAFVGRSGSPTIKQNISILRLERISYKYKFISTLNQPPKRLYHFYQSKFAEIEGSPMIYWWTETFRQWYLGAEKVGEIRQGMATSNNERFLRFSYELKINLKNISKGIEDWEPYIKGAGSLKWFEPLKNLIRWKSDGLEVKIYAGHLYKSFTRTIKSIDKYFIKGVSYGDISAGDFHSRLSKYPSIFDVTGSTIFQENPEQIQVGLSSKVIPYVSTAINPTIHNQVGDVKRFSIPKVVHWKSYIERARALYDEEFSKDETNIEYEYRGEV